MEQKQRFPSHYNWLALVPLAWLFVSLGLDVLQDMAWIINAVTGISALFALAILYITQLTYLKRNYPNKRLAPQLILTAATLICIEVALVWGDQAGRAHYGKSSGDIVGIMAGGLLLGAICTLFVVYAFTIGNMLFIATRGASSVLRLFGDILYAVSWLALAIFSYFVYAFTFSLHDPSLE